MFLANVNYPTRKRDLKFVVQTPTDIVGHEFAYRIYVIFDVPDVKRSQYKRAIVEDFSPNPVNFATTRIGY